MLQFPVLQFKHPWGLHLDAPPLPPRCRSLPRPVTSLLHARGSRASHSDRNRIRLHRAVLPRRARPAPEKKTSVEVSSSTAPPPDGIRVGSAHLTSSNPALTKTKQPGPRAGRPPHRLGRLKICRTCVVERVRTSQKLRVSRGEGESNRSLNLRKAQTKKTPPRPACPPKSIELQ